MLKKAWKDADIDGIPEPPKPIVLSSWDIFGDITKKERWDSTVLWAKTYGCPFLIPKLIADEMYIVEELVEPEPRINPDTNLEPKRLPTKTEADQAILKLTNLWPEITGPELSEHTKPLRLSGKKLRNLVVQAAPNYTPSWGGWDHLEWGPKRRSFTIFRYKVNQAIQPHEVDHITFCTDKL
ncbi:DUF721 domain-containing protein [Pseudodesulfovibrio sp.]|nr:DUF721 domain-containing protein [Pseudodesulfovibrio sp.]